MKRIFIYLTFFTFLGLCSFELYGQHTQEDKGASQGMIAIRSVKKEKVDQDVMKEKVKASGEINEEINYEDLFSLHN